MNRYTSLLLHYVLIYPLYQVAAMAVATVILSFPLDWSFEQAKNVFIVLGITMWFASFIIHWRIGAYALSGLLKRNE
ncbi:hypothetical protein A9165_15940 [Alishewanella sp. HH-ZS]|nr:hypothetical protein A9165_15940 [Alishewanella sp. HH-ZS]